MLSFLLWVFFLWGFRTIFFFMAWHAACLEHKNVLSVEIITQLKSKVSRSVQSLG